MPEYEVDGDSDDSARSLDSEFGVPIMQTPRVKKAFISTNEKLRHSSQVKTQVTRYAYNDYMVHHYAFAMKVATEQEPERPSLRHKLEGENSLNRANPQRKTQAEAQTSQLHTTQAGARIPQLRINASRRGLRNASRS